MPRLLRSVTIPFKNLIQHLSFYSFTPADPSLSSSVPPRTLSSSLIPSRTHSLARIIPSSLVLSSTHSSVKTPDTYPDPNHQSCHINDITALDPDPDPDLWLIFDYSLIPDSLIHHYYSDTYWCSLSLLTDPLYITKTHDSYAISNTASLVYKQAIGYLVSLSLIWLLPVPIAVVFTIWRIFLNLLICYILSRLLRIRSICSSLSPLRFER
jgi:hypothetical protein